MNSRYPIYCFILLILTILSNKGYSQDKDSRIFNDSALKISPIKINSIHSDFGPFVIQDTIYFTTFNDKLVGKSDWILRNKEFYDLYMAPIDKEGNITGKREPVEEFITKYNDGPVSFCQKTGELFVTQNYNDQSQKTKPFHPGINKLRIIIAKRINGKWKYVSEFPYNNPAYSVGHPSVTESGDTLVFSSDRPGGFGETDLYYSVRANGKWGIPVNFGPKINTSGKEEFAFLTDQHFNGQYLIFSSKGRFGNGGFDLYYTRFPSDYNEVGHFDGPINTKYDDFAMTIPPDAEFGFLTSNRPGTGDDDIYKFTFKRISKPQPKPVMQPKCRSLYVLDQTSRHPIPGVKIVSCDSLYYITDTNGKVPCIPCLTGQCEVKASSFGYPDKTKVLMECKMNNQGIVSDTIWMDILVNQKIALKNIYYDFDKWDILPESATELDRLVLLMKENPGMKVELGSHTDDRGTESYNLKLSQRRANSVVNYIVAKGINQSRIKGTGYGKSQLIHKGLGGLKCTPEQNRENRRTEIFIPGFIRGEAVRQDIGDYSDGKPNASKNYSSRKENESLIEPTPEVVKKPAEKTFTKASTEPKIENAPKSVNPPKAESVPKVVITPKKENTSRLAATKNPGSETIKYYLVLGSFKDKTEASKKISQLKTEGYETLIISESEPFRVGMGYAKFSQAKEQLELLKAKYNGAWILKK